MEEFLLDDGFNEKKLENNEAIGAANLIRKKANEQIKSIHAAKYAVWVALGLLTLGTVIEVVNSPELMVYSGVGYAVIASLYGLGLFLYKQKPALGLIICLCIYVLMNVLIAYGEPSIALKGLLPKILIIYYLGKGIYASFQLPKSIEGVKAYTWSQEDANQIQAYKPLAIIPYRQQHKSSNAIKHQMER